MENFSIDQFIHVVDIADGQHRKCRVTEKDDATENIKVHYVGWNEKYDEWLNMDSKRIVSAEDTLEDSSQHVVENPIERKRKEVIGYLIGLGDDSTKAVVSTYDIKGDSSSNEKTILKLNVPILKKCAETLKLKTLGINGKNLTKSLIAELIVRKVNSLMPDTCQQCTVVYNSRLDKKPLFTCYMCTRGSHDCADIVDFKSSLPSSLPRGFVWMCSECFGDDHSNKDVLIRENASSCEHQSTNLQPEHENPSKSTSMLKKSSTNEEEDSSNVEPASIRKSLEAKICNKFKRSICPHGMRGNKLVNGKKCSFNHPRSCKKYCSYGSRGKDGCKMGNNCPYFHPVLCRFSLTRKLCIKEGCSFVHLKGTARKYSDSGVMPNSSKENVRVSMENAKSSNVPMSSNSGKRQGAQDKSDFLQLKEMMEELRILQMKQMSSFREELNRLNYLVQGGAYPRMYSQVCSPYAHPPLQTQATGQCRMGATAHSSTPQSGC